jgi:hypothetical protein
VSKINEDELFRRAVQIHQQATKGDKESTKKFYWGQ